jgi:hypothetical protein
MQAYQTRANQNTLNSRVAIHDEYVEEKFDHLVTLPFKAAPIGIKDIILTK